MMLPPTEFELQHFIEGYNPEKAHEYYLRTRKLHPRQKGAEPEGFAKANAKRHESAKDKQKKELSARIESLSKKLNALEELIRKKEHDAKAEDRKSKAKKERSAKEKDKPKSAAEKAKAAREANKYRDKHKQELKTKAKEADKKSGGTASKKSGSTKTSSVSELRTLATKVKGQIAVAKQKLAAL